MIETLTPEQTLNANIEFLKLYHKFILGMSEIKQKYPSINFMRREGLLNQIIVKNLDDSDTIELQDTTIYENFRSYHINSIYVNWNEEELNKFQNVIKLFEKATTNNST